jgi:hypothetical protein
MLLSGPAMNLEVPNYEWHSTEETSFRYLS